MFNYMNMSNQLLTISGFAPLTKESFLILEKFINIYMNRYEYDGIPEETKNLYGNRKLWELYSFFCPAVAWFKDPVNGLMALPASGMWKYNSVGKPTEWTVYSVNGTFNKTLNEENSVLMFNDEAITIPYLHLSYETSFMRKLDLAMNQNIDLQSTPYVIEAYDESNKNANNWSNLLSCFPSKIVLRKNREKGAKNELLDSHVLDTNVELKINEFMKAYNEFQFRAFTYMGIKNVNIEKSERLLTGEVSANDILVQNNYTNALNMRQKCFDELYRKGIITEKITVKPTDLKTMFADISSAYMGNTSFGGDRRESTENAEAK